MRDTSFLYLYRLSTVYQQFVEHCEFILPIIAYLKDGCLMLRMLIGL
jgi:hypothetical protein